LPARPAERVRAARSGARLVEAKQPALRVEETLDRLPARPDSMHPLAELRLIQLPAAGLRDRAPDLRGAIGEGLLESLAEDGKGVPRQTHELHEGAGRPGGARPLENLR